jgi:3-methyladenine DNA glycosylase AlkC
MATALKHAFGLAVIERIAEALVAVEPTFPRARFVAEAATGLEDLELLARGRHVADALAHALPAPFARAVEILIASLGPPFDPEVPSGMATFGYLPHAQFVERHGLEDFEAAMRAIHAITQRFTGEWAIRPFLETEPARTLAVLARWARDPSVHVRRLVSEGTRPRLPWGARVRALIRDPSPILPLLETLRDDPSPYVRRSVANNLNDIAKDHPAIVVSTCRRWLEDAPAARRDLVRHALRSLVKSRHAPALALLGVADRPRVELVALRATPRRVAIGDAVTIEATLRSRSTKRQRLRLDLGLELVGTRAPRRRTFSLREIDLDGRDAVTLRKTISFRPMTTRPARPGRHRVELVANGVVLGDVTFTVVQSGRDSSLRTE